MIKRLQIAIILMFTAITLCVLSFCLTEKITSDITKDIESVQIYVLNDDNKTAIEKAKELTQKWERQYKVLSSYIAHEHLERIEVAINSVQTYLLLEDYRAALVICEDIKVCSEHLLISEKPNFSNIF